VVYLFPSGHISRLSGISIKRYDLSEPQAGKGPCDRSFAHQKGNDITQAVHIKRASESHGGVRNVVPYVVEFPESEHTLPMPRIPDVSLLPVLDLNFLTN